MLLHAFGGWATGINDTVLHYKFKPKCKDKSSLLK